MGPPGSSVSAQPSRDTVRVKPPVFGSGVPGSLLAVMSVITLLVIITRPGLELRAASSLVDPKSATYFDLCLYSGINFHKQRKT